MVAPEKAQEFAKEHGLVFMETSSLVGPKKSAILNIDMLYRSSSRLALIYKNLSKNW